MPEVEHPPQEDGEHVAPVTHLHPDLEFPKPGGGVEDAEFGKRIEADGGTTDAGRSGEPSMEERFATWEESQRAANASDGATKIEVTDGGESGTVEAAGTSFMNQFIDQEPGTGHEPEGPAREGANNERSGSAEGLPMSIDEFINLFKRYLAYPEEEKIKDFILSKTTRDEDWVKQHTETYTEVISKFAEDPDDNVRSYAIEQLDTLLEVDLDKGVELFKKLATDESSDREMITEVVGSKIGELITEMSLDSVAPLLEAYAEFLENQPRQQH